MILSNLKARNVRRGFTLLELMVAIALLSFIMVAIYSSWYSILRSTKIGETYAAEAQRTRIAIKAIEDALVGTVVFGENVRFYSFLMESEGDLGALAFTAHLSSSFPGSGLFGDQSIRRVTFTIEPDQERKNRLVMTQIPLLLETNETMTPYPIILAKDVSLFVPEVWDEQKREWATKWIATNQMPRMVRITIGTGKMPNSSDPEEIITRVVVLPGTAVMGDVQRPVNQPGGNRPRTGQ
jgi:general secretion pathway protein J